MTCSVQGSTTFGTNIKEKVPRLRDWLIAQTFVLSVSLEIKVRQKGASPKGQRIEIVKVIIRKGVL